MVTNIYTLPEISFVGGETQELSFRLYKRFESGVERPYDANSCTINFAVIGYSNKIGVPLISKNVTARADTENEAQYIADVTLSPADTVGLYGKYIYQLTLKDIDGNTAIPDQGILFITKNINQGFVLE